MNRADVLGTWHLRSWHNDLAGEITEPLGPTPVGYLMYTSEGYVSVVMGAPDPAGHDGALAHLSYAGRFEIEGDQVVHRVEASSEERWIGRELRRTAEIHGDVLRLRTEPRHMRRGTLTAELVWQRA